MARPGSLFVRLMAAMSLVLVAGAAVLAFAARQHARAAADDAYDQLLLGAAAQIGETLRAEAGKLSSDIPVSALEMLSAGRRERIYYRIVAPGGALVTGYEDLPLPPKPGLEGNAQYWNDTFKGEPVRLASLAQFIADPQAGGTALVLVAHTLNSREALAGELTLRAMLPVAVMSLIALMASAIGIRYALRPLARIEQALARRAPEDLTPLRLAAPAEIATLADAINHFMKRLSDQLDELQRMIADAAHQLRTPITALAAQVELLQHASGAPARRRHLERVASRTRQIGRLANQLLSQAMVRHRAERAERNVVDLAELARQAIADAVPAAMDRDIAVRLEAEAGPFSLLADPVSLREALRNLIENAALHGARSRIDIRLSRHAGAVQITVSDDGPGIAQAEWPHVTRRFYRAATSSEGFGLGLAIAHDVAESHGASLGFASSAGQFSVTLTFPPEVTA